VVCVLVLCGCCFFQGTPAIAQGEQPEAHPGTSSGQEATPSPAKPADQSEQSTGPDKSAAKPKEEKEKRGSIVAAPLPISSPAIGSGIIPVLGYIFPFSMKDKISPPSVVGAAGLITDNGSRGFAVGAQLYLKEDRYRITGGYVRGNIDYNIYGIGVTSDLKLPLVQTGHAYFGGILRRVWHQFFIGPRFFVGESLITLKPSTVTRVPIPPDIGLQTTLTSVGAVVTLDTSSNRFYPTGGMFFNFASDFFSQGLGSKYSLQSYKTTFSYYRSLSEKQVLAYNAFFCATGGEPPFYGNCIYGTNNELRGYTAGKYFTRYMLATQLEYRLQLPMRLGLVVFGGLGGVIPGGSQLLENSKFLPGGGGGLRFELSKKYHVNLRADIAQGTDGHTFGMGVGEAF
jgi:hypothetical protein